MDRKTELKIAEALNQAIWLRDNIDSLSDESITKLIVELGSYSVFSSRQLSAITNGKIAYGRIAKLIGKTNKTGGNLNVGTLDILRSILLSRADASTDYSLIADAVDSGTSQGMVSKLTGIPQGTISKKIRRNK
jgi:hypothetical protein